jgi:hypothetical protein
MENHPDFLADNTIICPNFIVLYHQQTKDASPSKQKFDKKGE